MAYKAPALVIDIPEGSSQAFIPGTSDIIALVKSGNRKALNRTVICYDNDGHPVALFGQDTWNCRPYAHTKESRVSKNRLRFAYLNSCPGLQLEAKIIVYGWLFHRSSTRSRPAKFSSIESRCNTPLNEIFSFLAENNHDSIVALNQTGVWQSFLAWVQSKDWSHNSVGHVFRTLRFIAKNACWHNIRLILPEFKVDDLAGRLCHNERRTHQQILALPQSVADTLYGEAIRFVELAWPHRLALEETERQLQENYLQAKSIVDAYLAEGRFPALVNPEGEITDKHRYSLTIKSFLRERVQDTIHSCLGPSGLLPGEKADGDWLKKFRGQLLTSCFICCAAFSGMRLSELFELTKDSFHTEVIGGETFFLLKGRTFKFGEKQETWVTSPITEKAIQLATSLTRLARCQLEDAAKWSAGISEKEHYLNLSRSLWLSQTYRSRLPVLIIRWNARLQAFAKQVSATIDNDTLRECITLNPNSRLRTEKLQNSNTNWPMTTHMFRRTLAVFAVKNNLGSAIAIKQQFGHLRLKMSEWYCEGGIASRMNNVLIDTELQDLIDRERLDNNTRLYYDWFNGIAPLSGTHGKAIVAMRQDLPVVYRSWESIWQLLSTGRLTLHGTLHGYCKNGYDCSMDGVVNPAFCVNCRGGGSIIDAENAAWWKRKHAQLIVWLAENPTFSPQEYAHCITQIRAAENVMQDFDLPFQRYEGKGEQR